MLVERDEYLNHGVHIGTMSKMEDMDKFIYRVKKNKLALINLELTDERIETAGEFLSEYSPEKVLVVSRKENGFRPVVEFSKSTGADKVIGRFMPGILTNPQSDDFREPELVIVTDPEEDKQVIKESVDAKIPVIGICDTVNKLDYIDYVIPANNKGKKALGMVYYLLAREWIKNMEDDTEFNAELEDFIPE